MPSSDSPPNAVPPRETGWRRARRTLAWSAGMLCAIFSTASLAAPPASTTTAPQTSAPPARNNTIQRLSHTEPVTNDRFAADAARASQGSASPTNRTTHTPPESKTRLSDSTVRERRSSQTTASNARPLITTFASLAIVLGVFGAVVWAMRRGMPKTTQRLPATVVELLGQTQLAYRQNLQLIRLGHKLLLVCVSANGAETLGEVTDQEEVERLSALCQGSRPAKASASFRDVLQQVRGGAARSVPTAARASTFTSTKAREV